jgi:hypothetical protein
VNVPIEVLTEKPVPVTVTDEPAAPDEGTRSIDGVVTVKAVEAVTTAEIGSLTTIRPLLEPLAVSDTPEGMPPEALVMN